MVLAAITDLVGIKGAVLAPAVVLGPQKQMLLMRQLMQHPETTDLHLGGALDYALVQVQVGDVHSSSS